MKVVLAGPHVSMSQKGQIREKAKGSILGDRGDELKKGKAEL
jgi:hypothetical protein